MTQELLSKVKVLDVTHGVAGPFCTRILADLGAEVLKIEEPGGGDPARCMGPFPGDEPHPEKSGLFLYLNMNKKGVTLNLDSAAGAKIFRKLVRDADILVEDFEPGVMPGLGLDYASLEKINPRLVMVSITGFGQTGPYRDYKASEIVVEALSGLLHSLGDKDRGPVKLGLHAGQILAGPNAAASALVALFYQRRTGTGQHIDVSITETIAQSTYFYGLWYSHGGMVAGRRNLALGRMGAAGDVFPCKDGYFVPLWIGVEWEKFVNFFNASGGPLDDPRFGSLAGRLLNAQDMETALEDLTRDRGKHDLFHSGQEWRLPWAVVQDAGDLLKCPQLTAREFFLEVDHPAAGKLTYPGLPYKISDVPRSGMRPAPLLGQHNAEVYCERLGCAREDLATLRDMGII